MDSLQFVDENRYEEMRDVCILPRVPLDADQYLRQACALLEESDAKVRSD